MSLLEKPFTSPIEDAPPFVDPVRLEYGAVPLAPWQAHTLEDMYEPYVPASIRRIRNKAISAVTGALNEGWVQSLDLALELSDLIELSLYDSQMMRIRRNPVATLGAVADREDARVIRAEQGTATPADMLGVLMDNPGLQSAELAKLNHPLDAKATEEMDNALTETLKSRMEMADDPQSYYKKKTLREDIPAVTILQKTPMARLETPHGMLWVVRRKAFLVRGDNETDTNDPFFDRKVKNEDRYEEELYPTLDARLRLGGEIPEVKWLQPLSTSYYAHYDQPSIVTRT